ncbi:MAG: hypothetical protein WB762_35690 [Candidatus Sulfotelmatobacter sp.]
MKLGMGDLRWWRAAGAFALLVTAGLGARGWAKQLTLDELKERVSGASVAERPALCIEIAERQEEAAGRLYAAGDVDKAEAALADVAAFSELARDYAIQSHKHEKQSEIAIRKMARKLLNLKHTFVREDQKQIQDTIDRLEKIRDDLLAAMFPNGVKK